jgi:uncharacterized membrane protein
MWKSGKPILTPAAMFHTRMLDYYDALLAAIPVAIGLGALVSVHEAVAMYQGLAAGTIVATGVVVELLFRNPPVERASTRAGGTALVGFGWLLTVLLMV